MQSSTTSDNALWILVYIVISVSTKLYETSVQHIIIKNDILFVCVTNNIFVLYVLPVLGETRTNCIVYVLYIYVSVFRSINLECKMPLPEHKVDVLDCGFKGVYLCIIPFPKMYVFVTHQNIFAYLFRTWLPIGIRLRQV